MAGLLAEAPRLLRLDRRDRGDFLRAFYRRYEGAPVDQLRFDSYELFSDLLGLRAFPEAIARVRRHRALGHKTLLITGALDFVVEPLRPLFDEIVCAHMSERDGKLTGELTDSPPTGEARALLMDEFAHAQGLSLGDTIAYADSTSDLPMLEAAGFPVVVNPEAKLAAIARRRGWFIEHWERAAGGPRRSARGRDPASGSADTTCDLAAKLDERTGQMKALQFERNLPRFAAARIASSVRRDPAEGVRVGPLELVEIEPFAAPRARLGTGAAPAGGDLRLRPRHLGRPQLQVLRAHRQLSVRSRPRGGRRCRRRRPRRERGR